MSIWYTCTRTYVCLCCVKLLRVYPAAYRSRHVTRIRAKNISINCQNNLNVWRYALENAFVFTLVPGFSRTTFRCVRCAKKLRALVLY